jgi:hypothetical protein
MLKKDYTGELPYGPLYPKIIGVIMKKYPHISFLLFAITIMTFLVLIALPAGADSRDSLMTNKKISLDVKNEPLDDVCDKISKASGYNIIMMDPKWADLQVSVSAKNEPLLDVLKNMLRTKNLALISDEASKDLTIWLVDKSLLKQPSSQNGNGENKSDFPPDNVEPESFEELLEKYGAENIKILPPTEPGEKGVSYAEIQKVIKQNQQALDQMSPDEIEVLPPDKPGEKGVTMAEMAATQEQRKDLNINWNEMEVLPPSKPGEPGITLSEVQKHSDQNEEIDFDILLPPERE